MKHFIVAGMVALLGMAALAEASETCFLNSEKVSGSNKICYYRCIGGTAAMTVGSLDFCPMSIQR